MKTISIKELELDELLMEIRSIVKEEIRSQRPAPEEEWLEMQDAVHILKKAKQTIYQLCSSKSLPHYKRSGKTYFKRSELMQWLEKGKQEAF
jgi:excisionase family DNA binding protein